MGNSTVTAMIQLYDKWVELMEEGKLLGIMLIDQSDAFDLCDHEVLKRKIRILCGGGAASYLLTVGKIGGAGWGLAY